MVDGNKLFYPTTNKIRNPKNEGSMPVVNGNIINPPTMAQIGGMSSADKAGLRDQVRSMLIVKPGASTRRVPFSGGQS